MIERQIHLSSGGGAALQGYDGLLRFGYTKNRGVYRGSPPRMRGKEVDALGFSCGHGITPAYAGKSIFLYRCVVLCYILFRAIRQSTP